MTDISTELQLLWQRGCDFLGTQTAIMCGAMTWVSERGLVAAVSNAGGFGLIACGAMTPDMLRDEIGETRKLTDKPFGVNLIVMHPELETLANICVEEGVSHVVLAGGVPKKETIDILKAGNIKVMALPTTLALAKRMIRNGIDAIIIEGSEAGGHIGPVSLTVLAQEILPELADQVPIFVAGGIARGEAIASYLEMGAAGAQLGTRFVVANESTAHEKFKKAFIRAGARDAITTMQIDPRFPVIPVRALANEGTSEFINKQKEVIAKFEAGDLDMEAAQLEIEHFWAGALRRAVRDGEVESGSLMAGQSVGMIKEIQPCQAIIAELVTQAENALSAKSARTLSGRSQKKLNLPLHKLPRFFYN